MHFRYSIRMRLHVQLKTRSEGQIQALLQIYGTQFSINVPKTKLLVNFLFTLHIWACHKSHVTFTDRQWPVPYLSGRSWVSSAFGKSGEHTGLWLLRRCPSIQCSIIGAPSAMLVIVNERKNDDGRRSPLSGCRCLAQRLFVVLSPSTTGWVSYYSPQGQFPDAAIPTTRGLVANRGSLGSGQVKASLLHWHFLHATRKQGCTRYPKPIWCQISALRDARVLT